MGKRILKDWKDVHMGVKVLKVILLRRRMTTPNKESSRTKNEKASSRER